MTPRWIVSGSAIITCAIGLIAIHVEGGQGATVMAPALITVLAVGQITAVLLYPLFLIISLVFDPAGRDVLTPGVMLFNILILVTVWAARNQGIRATKLAFAAEHAAYQAEARTHYETQLKHFLRAFQHELRNGVDGMGGLIASARTMLDEINPAITVHAGPSGVTIDAIFTALTQTADGLQTVSQQLLLLTRDQRVSLRKHQTPLLPLLQHVRTETITRSERYHIPLHMDITCDPSLSIYGDDAWIGLAVRTAIRNAVDGLTLMEPDHVGSIQVRGCERDGRIQIAISDNGPGFSAEYLAQLRDLNTEASLLGWTTKSGGSGLGIAFMIQVIRLHNGTIEFSNNQHGGATVVWQFQVGESG
jgi:signal transduction histidine kinase